MASKRETSPIKIKTVESVKNFYDSISDLDIVVGNAVLLQEGFGRFLNFFDNDSKALKQEFTCDIFSPISPKSGNFAKTGAKTGISLM